MFFTICVISLSCKTDPSERQAEVSRMSLESMQDGRERTAIPGAWRLTEYIPMLLEKRVALVVNHSSRVGEKHLVDTLLEFDIEVRHIFAPEHGFRGDADAGSTIANQVDAKTGIPIISLYGNTKKPRPEHLEGIDAVVFDIQDVGVRFYTYISTLHFVMEACAENNVPVIVLDRPNPNGYYVDGPVLYEEFRSFVGMHPIPVVYGMTIGELASMINGEGWLANGIRADLTIIPCKGYDHNISEPLPVPPSPNLPNHRAVLLYPSLCFFEGTMVSVGRGTETQFQVLGHPDYAPGSYSFTPQSRPGAGAPPHLGVHVTGVSLTGLETTEIRQWNGLNLQWLTAFHHYLHPKEAFYGNVEFFDKLAGTDALRLQLDSGMGEKQIRSSWQQDIADFLVIRKKYLLYPDFAK